MNIASKLRLIGLSNIHSILDKVIDLNSVAAVKQHIRDLGASRDIVDAGVTSSIARERDMSKKKREKAGRVTELTSVITTILTDDNPLNDAAAKPKMAEKMRLDGEIIKLGEDLTTEAETKGTLEQALVAINEQISEMEGRLEVLESTEKQAAAKDEAASALKSARLILQNAPGSRVDSALQRAEKQSTEAGVRLEREMGQLGAVTDKAGKDVEVDAALAAFKASLPKKEGAAA